MIPQDGPAEKGVPRGELLTVPPRIPVRERTHGQHGGLAPCGYRLSGEDAEGLRPPGGEDDTQRKGSSGCGLDHLEEFLFDPAVSSHQGLESVQRQNERLPGFLDVVPDPLEEGQPLPSPRPQGKNARTTRRGDSAQNGLGQRTQIRNQVTGREIGHLEVQRVPPPKGGREEGGLPRSAWSHEGYDPRPRSVEGKLERGLFP